MRTIKLVLLFAILAISCRAPMGKYAASSIDSIAYKKMMHARVVAGNFSDQKDLHFDSTTVQEFIVKYPELAAYEKDLQNFYRRRDYAYAWYDSAGMIEQASGLFNRIQNAREVDGLSLQFPYQKNFQGLMEDSDQVLHREPRNAMAELMLTSQYFSFAQHVWQGLSEEEMHQLDWFVVKKKLDVDELLDSLLSSKVYRNINEPVYRQYGLLRTWLKKYRAIDSVGGWSRIVADKKYYEKGDTSPVIRRIRKHLFLTGDYSGDTTSVRFTNDLELAVKIYQERHGLEKDGVIGKKLIDEMNVPVGKRIQQIIVNMERSRWVPVSMEGDYIVVNIPAYKLYVYKDDSLVWDMNVVVGKTMSKTVIFNGDLKYIVFSPYWNIPPTIMRDEVLPGIQRDSNYLEKNNMEKVGNLIREKPGPNNSLGRVKFLFPNSYSIYLHDTPSKSLFSKDNRAFSHGCIRLSQPKRLAMYLLRDYSEWSEEKIEEAMNATEEKWVTLRKPVPVFIAYFTAWVDREGKLNFRPDIYDNDDRLAQMILAEK